MSCGYGMPAFLFRHNVCPSRFVTTAVLLQCLVVLTQHSRLNTYGRAVLMQLCSLWLYVAQNWGSRNCEWKFLPSKFCAPLKVAHVARVMPAIP